MTTTTQRRAAPSPRRAVALVLEGHAIWYARNWRVSVVSSDAANLVVNYAATWTTGAGSGSRDDSR